MMPVYMEPLSSVIIPTVESLEAAIRTYEWQGGTAAIFICDDGLQVMCRLCHLSTEACCTACDCCHTGPMTGVTTAADDSA